MAALLGAPSVPGLSAAQPAAGGAAPSPSALDAVTRGLLLPTLPGYCPSPPVHAKQPDPNRLTERQRRLIFFPYYPDSPELVDRSLGWAQPDRAYVATIPAAARDIPANLDGSPVLRFNNVEINGERELRWRSVGDYDQWFLRI